MDQEVEHRWETATRVVALLVTAASLYVTCYAVRHFSRLLDLPAGRTLDASMALVWLLCAIVAPRRGSTSVRLRGAVFALLLAGIGLLEVVLLIKFLVDVLAATGNMGNIGAPQ